MIAGAHTIIYTSDADALRVWFRDVLGFASVDAGNGWLIFQLPPGEVAMHPAEGTSDGAHHELYLMCDDIDATVAELTNRGATFKGGISEQRWGRLATILLPDGGELGIYEPRHPVAAATGEPGAGQAVPGPG